MSVIEQTIDVDVPVSTAYGEWTRFETFPKFMEGVDRIEQTTPTMTHWVTSVGGVTREFDAQVTEQRPDELVAWQSVDGPRQAGIVTFQPLGPEVTRVHLQMDFEPQGLMEQAGDKLGIVERRVTGDLERFKHYVESRDPGARDPEALTPDTQAWRDQEEARRHERTGTVEPEQNRRPPFPNTPPEPPLL